MGAFSSLLLRKNNLNFPHDYFKKDSYLRTPAKQHSKTNLIWLLLIISNFYFLMTWIYHSFHPQTRQKIDKIVKHPPWLCQIPFLHIVFHRLLAKIYFKIPVIPPRRFAEVKFKVYVIPPRNDSDEVKGSPCSWHIVSTLRRCLDAVFAYGEAWHINTSTSPLEWLCHSSRGLLKQ
jgi:NADH:ubiquinone oxidoreductase subunit 5 (subunit L)/multisubunit Na+/H+ antiporter MnhA subunit